MDAIGEFLAAWAAAEQAGDTAALGTQLAGDFTTVGPAGFVLTKEAWLARHRHGELRYEEFGVSEVTARTLAGAAIVTARLTSRGSYQGHPIPEALRATLTLAGTHGRWQLAALHMSFIAGTPGAPPIPGAHNRPGGERSAA